MLSQQFTRANEVFLECLLENNGGGGGVQATGMKFMEHLLVNTKFIYCKRSSFVWFAEDFAAGHKFIFRTL